jgi:hypothetical protein
VVVLESQDFSAMRALCCFENIVAIFGLHTSLCEIVEIEKLLEEKAD